MYGGGCAGAAGAGSRAAASFRAASAWVHARGPAPLLDDCSEGFLFVALIGPAGGDNLLFTGGDEDGGAFEDLLDPTFAVGVPFGVRVGVGEFFLESLLSAVVEERVCSVFGESSLSGDRTRFNDDFLSSAVVPSALCSCSVAPGVLSVAAVVWRGALVVAPPSQFEPGLPIFSSSSTIPVVPPEC